MKLIADTKHKVATFVLVIVLAGCGGSLLPSLRAGIAASAPLRSSLVASGTISQELSDAIGRDFNDGAACADALQMDFKAISSDDPEKKAKKFAAAQKAEQCWRPIVLRQNFAKHPRIQNAADIVDAIFSAIVIFYSPSTSDSAGPRRAPRGVRGTQPATEEELEKDLKEKIKSLQAAFRP